jgi:hypothetical protein
VRVRIGVNESSREIEVDVDKVDAFIKDAETAIKGDGQILWVTDIDGHRVGLPARNIAYIDISPDAKRSAGF